MSFIQQSNSPQAFTFTSDFNATVLRQVLVTELTNNLFPVTESMEQWIDKISQVVLEFKEGESHGYSRVFNKNDTTFTRVNLEILRQGNIVRITVISDNSRVSNAANGG